MNLLYKPDWEETKERFLTWWAGESFGRCAMSVTAPKKIDNGKPHPLVPDDPVKRWTDLEFITELNDYYHSRTFYGGEAFPIWNGGYPGHASLSSFLGSPITLDMNTGWHEPILNGINWKLDDIRLDRNSRWYRFAIDLLKTSARESKGKSIPTIGAFGGCGDTLASIRGTMRLLTDVIDYPELVIETELYIMDIWIDIYQEFYDIISPVAEGSTCWFPLWSPGKFYATQCDFSYMISPKMFEKLFIPCLEKQLEYLDHSVYHVDGIEAFRHVPVLCDLPRLQAIQILPGAGKPSPLYYMSVLKEVQNRGKNLHISIPPSEVEIALKELSSKGLFIDTWCRSEDEARKMLDNAEKWSR